VDGFSDLKAMLDMRFELRFTSGVGIREDESLTDQSLLDLVEVELRISRTRSESWTASETPLKM
jgi:hypothetical protein